MKWWVYEGIGKYILDAPARIPTLNSPVANPFGAGLWASQDILPAFGVGDVGSNPTRPVNITGESCVSTYHLRRPEKEISDPSELRRILSTQRYLTIAMCRDGEPYLVTLNFAYDPDAGCLYFHCAPEGRKLDFLRENPVVWGQVIEDSGYLQGECDHAFRSVHFRGLVELLPTVEEKRRALEFMIRRLEDEPERRLGRLQNAAKLERTVVGRIRIEALTGKANLPAKGV